MIPAQDGLDRDTPKYPSLFSFEACQEHIYGETFGLLSKKKILKGSEAIINNYRGMMGNRNSELLTLSSHKSIMQLELKLLPMHIHISHDTIHIQIEIQIQL